MYGFFPAFLRRWPWWQGACARRCGRGSRSCAVRPPGLPFQVRQARRDLVGMRLAVSRRTALDDVGDEAGAAGKPDGRNPLVQVLSGRSHEGTAGPVFLFTGALADEHHRRMEAAFPGNRRFSPVAEAALHARGDFGSNRAQAVLGGDLRFRQLRSGRGWRDRGRRGGDRQHRPLTGEPRAHVVLEQVQRLPEIRQGFQRPLHTTPFPGTARAQGRLPRHSLAGRSP